MQEAESSRGIRARLRRIAVTGESPDGTVLVHLTDDGPQVDLLAGRRHTEASLAAAVGAAMQAAHACYADAVADEVGPAAARAPGPAGTPGQRRRDRFAAAVDELAVSVTSRLGHVTVSWHGAAEVVVTFRPGVLGLVGLTYPQLAADIASALTAVTDQRGQLLARLFTESYRAGARARQGDDARARQ